MTSLTGAEMTTSIAPGTLPSEAKNPIESGLNNPYATQAVIEPHNPDVHRAEVEPVRTDLHGCGVKASAETLPASDGAGRVDCSAARLPIALGGSRPLCARAQRRRTNNLPISRPNRQ